MPETVVSPTPDGDHTEGLITAGAGSSDGHHDYLVLLNDISSLIEKGRSDREITEELDLSNAFIKAVAYLRQRGDELPRAAF